MDPSPGVLLTVTREGKEVVVFARGQLDFATNQMLLETMNSAADLPAVAYALDLDMVSFIDSETVKALLCLQDSFAKLGKTLRVSKGSPQVARTFGLLGVADILGFGQSASVVYNHV